MPPEQMVRLLPLRLPRSVTFQTGRGLEQLADVQAEKDGLDLTGAARPKHLHDCRSVDPVVCRRLVLDQPAGHRVADRPPLFRRKTARNDCGSRCRRLCFGPEKGPHGKLVVPKGC